MDCTILPGSSIHGIFQSKSTGVGSRSLLQRIFPTWGSNPGLPHCRQTLSRLRHQGSSAQRKWLDPLARSVFIPFPLSLPDTVPPGSPVRDVASQPPAQPPGPRAPVCPPAATNRKGGERAPRFAQAHWRPPRSRQGSRPPGGAVFLEPDGARLSEQSLPATRGRAAEAGPPRLPTPLPLPRRHRTTPPRPLPRPRCPARVRGRGHAG